MQKSAVREKPFFQTETEQGEKIKIIIQKIIMTPDLQP